MAVLAVGDQFTLDGQSGAVVATTATLDANGRGSIVYGGATFQFVCYRHRKGAFANWSPITTIGEDAYLRVGLAQQTADPTLFALVFDDPWAGRHCGGDKVRWYPASQFAAQDSVVFNAGWAPGTITITKAGVPEAGVYADILLRYATSNGAYECWWQPAYPNGAGVGSFVTDGNGRLWHRWPDGSFNEIVFPRYVSALGHRSGDTWPSGPVCERILTSAEVWYLQEKAVISASADTTLDVIGCSIVITADANSEGACYGNDGQAHALYACSGAGTATVTGIPPGRYAVSNYESTNEGKGNLRQYVTVGTGQTANVTFGALAEQAVSYAAGAIYKEGAEPAPNVTIWGVYEDAPGVMARDALAVTAADGSWGPVDVTVKAYLNLDVDDALGAMRSGNPAPVTTGYWWDGALRARQFVIRSWNSLQEEGVKAWGADGPHENVQAAAFVGYFEDTASKQRYNIYALGDGGYTSDPMPGWHWSSWPILPAARHSYNLYGAQGDLLEAWGSVPSDTNSAWAAGATEAWCGSSGGTYLRTLGGKIHGATVQASRSRQIPSSDVEPWRLGLEFGKSFEAPGIEWRIDRGGDKLLALPAMVCPYDRYPVWLEPTKVIGGKTYTRYRCTNVDTCNSDARFSAESPTLASLSGWFITTALVKSSGVGLTRYVPGHPRPEDYDETAGYLATIGSLSRWKAIHILLGTLQGGTFTDGESIADAEARTGRHIGPVMLKLELQNAYSGPGCTVTVYATDIGGITRTLQATVLPGTVNGAWVPLDWHPHHEYPRGYYTDVTGASVVGGGYLWAKIVNDGPAWHSSAGVEVPHNAYEVWACDVALGGREPHMAKDHAGRVHLVYLRDGEVRRCVIPPGLGTIGASQSVSQAAGSSASHEHPSIVPHQNGRLTVCSTRNAVGVLYVSANDGDSWNEGPI